MPDRITDHTAEARRLRRKIADRSAHLGVIGLGYVGLPLVKPETFSPANFGPHIASLIAGRQVSRIVVVTHPGSQIFPELTADMVRSALDALGFVPDDLGAFTPSSGTLAKTFKRKT